MNIFSQRHQEFLKSLLLHEVKFILVGGHAAIYYGVNRNTGDLDILIEPTAANGLRLIESLKSLGLDVPDLKPAEFETRIILSFGLEPDAVDILNYTPGVDFPSAYANALEIAFSDITLKVINIQDLIRNKETLKRKGEKSLMDQYDAEVLKKIISRQQEG